MDVTIIGGLEPSTAHISISLCLSSDVDEWKCSLVAVDGRSGRPSVDNDIGVGFVHDFVGAETVRACLAFHVEVGLDHSAHVWAPLWNVHAREKSVWPADRTERKERQRDNDRFGELDCHCEESLGCSCLERR